MTTLTRLLTLSLELQELHDLMPTATCSRFTAIAHAIADKQQEKDVLESAWFAGRAIQREWERRQVGA